MTQRTLDKTTEWNFFFGVAPRGSGEATDKKKEVTDEKKEVTDETDGIHGFPELTTDLEEIISTNPIWRVPQEHQQNGRTIRAIACVVRTNKPVGDPERKFIYALTKSRIYALYKSPIVVKHDVELLDLFPIDKRTKSKKVVGQDNLSGNLCSISGGGMLIALYLKSGYDKTSYLLHDCNGKLGETEIIKEISPTGKIVKDGTDFFIPCGKHLKRLVPDKNSYSLDHHFSYEMPGNIISAACDTEIIVCADDLQNYQVINRKSKKRSIIEERTTFGRQILPSGATSLAIANYQEHTYVLFGENLGKIILYKVEHDESGQPNLKYHKTATFLSLDSCMQDIGQDNNIHELRVDKGWANFYLRRSYLRIGISQLLEHDFKAVIPGETEYNSQDQFIQQVKQNKDIRQVYLMPHRATCGDMFSEGG